jgi:hypothetical protein
MSPLLQQVLWEIVQLTPEEQLEVISQATAHLQRGAMIGSDSAIASGQISDSISEQISEQIIPKPKHKWLDIAGTAPYPLVGEDVQEWVTRTRREGQEHCDRLLGRERED